MCFRIPVVRCKTTRILIKLYIFCFPSSELVNIVCAMFAVSVYRVQPIYTRTYIIEIYHKPQRSPSWILRCKSYRTNAVWCSYLEKLFFRSRSRFVIVLYAFKIHGIQLLYPVYNNNNIWLSPTQLHDGSTICTIYHRILAISAIKHRYMQLLKKYIGPKLFDVLGQIYPDI